MATRKKKKITFLVTLQWGAIFTSKTASRKKSWTAREWD